jgi:hypothetical protein
MNEFYVGYLPKAPAGIARRIKTLIVILLVLGAIAAIAFARVQKTFAPSTFEYGKERTFQGVVEISPYPTLDVPGSSGRDGKAMRYLLVAAGKHGADGQVAAFAGKTVRVRGTLIYRSNQTMIELVKDSIAVIADANQIPAPATDLGEFDLTGEIVDSKCYLGVMNPGNGKVHRDCAVRCLSGRIPPIFATNDFRGIPAILLLTDAAGKPLPKQAFLNLVAQPVRVHGEVLQTGNTLFLKIELAAISPLP